LRGTIHERIPMVTLGEQRALLRENLEADEKFWTDLHGMHANTVEENKKLASRVERKIAERQAEMAKTADQRDTTRTRRERLNRGEISCTLPQARRSSRLALTGTWHSASGPAISK
jgi:hypothetical protein